MTIKGQLEDNLQGSFRLTSHVLNLFIHRDSQCEVEERWKDSKGQGTVR